MECWTTYGFQFSSLLERCLNYLFFSDIRAVDTEFTFLSDLMRVHFSANEVAQMSKRVRLLGYESGLGREMQIKVACLIRVE